MVILAFCFIDAWPGSSLCSLAFAEVIVVAGVHTVMNFLFRFCNCGSFFFKRREECADFVGVLLLCHWQPCVAISSAFSMGSWLLQRGMATALCPSLCPIMLRFCKGMNKQQGCLAFLSWLFFLRFFYGLNKRHLAFPRFDVLLAESSTLKLTSLTPKLKTATGFCCHSEASPSEDTKSVVLQELETQKALVHSRACFASVEAIMLRSHSFHGDKSIW